MMDKIIIFGFLFSLIFTTSNCRSNELHGHARGAEWIKGKRHLIQSSATDMQGHVTAAKWFKGKRGIHLKVMMDPVSNIVPFTMLHKSTVPRDKLKSRSTSITGKGHLTNALVQMSFPSGKVVLTPTARHLQLLRKPFLRLTTKLVRLRTNENLHLDPSEQVRSRLSTTSQFFSP